MIHRTDSTEPLRRTRRAPSASSRAIAWRAAAVFGACLALLTTLLVTFGAGTASAHGAVSDPPARHYGCYFRWPNGPSPQMAAEDPMCHKAWQADPSAMYNWNGLLRDGVGGDHQAAVPDGQLCSGGMTFNGRYAAFDEPGAWKTVDRPSRFTLNLNDTSSHGADYIRVYATKQGFDAKTQKPRWADLELVGQTGRIATGTRTPVEVDAPGRTGHHVLFTVWQASHGDQSYYFCSDVNFTDGGTTPTTTTTTTTATTTTTTTDVPERGCTASYRVTSQWSGGFQAEVRVTAGSAPITGWTAQWAFTNGERINSSWSATLTASGPTISARNAAYNGSLGAGASATFGFVASGTASTPALTCTAS
ncbi:lytic polysaccharide monooxygenase auxiliary activity family 9 protein [Saccharothrix yanglingensis]|uniref:Cellulose-binding protein n=1 Tax=Saccharothrix yanglingensis TaxID=659496 RepID=A0ABU0XAY6_9PSEU|nr:lytic polysaccharide monooxygenase [Saccharothrix yanglingensis]MDQ2588389.1 cellulose-binding protein [Saccharothrix yanglingensis]